MWHAAEGLMPHACSQMRVLASGWVSPRDDGDRGDDTGAPCAMVRIREKLANFEASARVYSVDELPRSTMGKMQKNVMRDRHSGLRGGT